MTSIGPVLERRRWGCAAITARRDTLEERYFS